jgi:hypothetical protein
MAIEMDCAFATLLRRPASAVVVLLALLAVIADAGVPATCSASYVN